MNETEKALFHVALGAAIFIVGYHLGKAGPRVAQSGGASAPVQSELDPFAWFATYGGNWR